MKAYYFFLTLKTTLQALFKAPGNTVLNLYRQRRQVARPAFYYLVPALAIIAMMPACSKKGAPTPPVVTPVPAISGISPATGISGTTITINGTNFDADKAKDIVKFNGTAATVNSATATALQVAAPAGGTSGAVTVTTAGGTATGPAFTYILAPTITSISPNSGHAGATVTITGTNFDTNMANDAVKFNGTAATVTAATATQITVTAPAGGTTGNVTVTTTAGTSNGVTFTYQATASGPDVYIMGTDIRQGWGYWKNSTFTAIGPATSEYCITGSGNDIYIAGSSTTGTPTYYKNGTPVQLSNQTGYTFSMAVSGSDVACVGVVGNQYYYWKNGTQAALQTTSTIATDTYAGYYMNNLVTISNGDVYIAGSEYLDRSNIVKATYWKNGVAVDLTDGIHTGSAWATAICVSGSDVYVAGIEQITDPTTQGIIGSAPMLWKNGVSIPITAPGSNVYTSISSIVVSGSDVYLGGQYNSKGAVWKNGNMINTAAYAVAENVSGLFLYNNTLYASGASSVWGNNCYWVNGNFVEMDPGCHVQSASCTATFSNQSSGIYVK